MKLIKSPVGTLPLPDECLKTIRQGNKRDINKFMDQLSKWRDEATQHI